MADDAGFDYMFDETFGMPDDNGDKWNAEFDAAEQQARKLKTELAAAKNKVELLCNGYEEARTELFNLHRQKALHRRAHRRGPSRRFPNCAATASHVHIHLPPDQTAFRGKSE